MRAHGDGDAHLHRPRVDLKGFYSPVDMNDALNMVKAGSTVPLKFEIFAGTTEFTTTDKIASFKVGKVPVRGARHHPHRRH